MRFQVITNKENVITAWATGTAYYSQKGNKTHFINIKPNELLKLNKGYKGEIINKQLVLTKTQKVIDDEMKEARMTILKQKAKQKVLTPLEVQELLLNMLE